MRITAGKFAGRTLEFPKGPRIRPTQDQVRQALFNIIGVKVEQARVLDLFAGSGSLGIEALSRGAAHATFLDRSGFSIGAIETNLERLLGKSAWEYSTFLKSDVLLALPKLAAKAKLFDLVFVDPPYDGDLVKKTLSAISRYAIVSETGWVVAEHAKRDPLPPEFEGPARHLKLQRLETYGDTALALYA